METRYDVVVVGAGHAGVQVATGLVKAGYDGTVALLGAEEGPPYERPPLSKGYLSGDQAADDLHFRSKDYWDSSPVALHLATRVTRVDPAAHVVETAHGARVSYGSLVWAAGVRPRALPVPGAGLLGVAMIRELADTDHVRVLLEGARSAVVVGGGYIGLEAAATLRKQGLDVVVVEAQDRVLQRVTGPFVSDYYAARHTREGVGFRLGAGVSAIEGHDGRVSGVLLADGERLPADLVLVGIGVVPETDVLAAAGAVVDNGLLTDARQRTNLPDVYAVGDCSRSPHALLGPDPVRFESVPSAVEQANAAVAAITGAAPVERGVPWFWSDQYDVKLKSVGLAAGAETHVVRGDPAADSFSVFYLRAGRLVAADCVNRPRDFAQAKRLVAAAVTADPGQLADDGVPLKDLLP